MEDVGGSRDQRPGSVEVALVGSLGGLLFASAAFRVTTSSQTLLAAMAAHTSRLRCGVIATGVTYRHSAVLANMVVTIDHVSGGRLELGMGAAWYELEHEQYGIAFPPIGVRAEMLREACLILKLMWTKSERRSRASTIS